MKVLYGLLSDSVPVFGARRKPYMLLGYVLISLSMLALMWCTDLTLALDGPPPPRAPSMKILSALFFILGVGVWLADVMGDSLVVRCLFIYICYVLSAEKKDMSHEKDTSSSSSFFQRTGRKSPLGTQSSAREIASQMLC
eukprot:scaffold15108_cov180-Amphora_coffeaeformis.AAC.76